jgi:hypothetical protein
MSAAEPSEYVAIALNGRVVEPTGKLVGEASSTSIEDNIIVFVDVNAVVDVDVDEQAAMTIVKAATNP